MKITIESTEMLTEIDGRKCRVWRGVTERGVQCDVLVTRLRVRSDADCTQFENELQEMGEPRLVVDMRHVW